MSNSSRPNIHLCLISVEVSYFWSTHTHTLTHILTHTHTYIDESCSQANWNLDMDYSCLVDEPGESPNYEFQTSWPRCTPYDPSLFWSLLKWKCSLSCLDFFFLILIFFIFFIVRQNNTRKTKAMATGQLKQTCQGIRENKVGVSCCRSS